MRVDFDRRLKLEFHGSKITSDAGLLAYRALDEVPGLTDLAGAAVSDLRRGKNRRHLLTGLLRQSIYGRLAGYEDTLQTKLIKIGAKVVRHGRYITFQLAEVAIPRDLLAEILRQIHGLRPAPLPP